MGEVIEMGGDWGRFQDIAGDWRRLKEIGEILWTRALLSIIAPNLPQSLPISSNRDYSGLSTDSTDFTDKSLIICVICGICG
jgi:hypothetical protein